MSQIDPDDYQTEGSSALKDAANKAGKTVTKKVAKKAGQAAAIRANVWTSCYIRDCCCCFDSRDDCHFYICHCCIWW